MKKITYAMHLKSSVIVSPRSGQALYKGIDEFCMTPEAEIMVSKVVKKREVKVVYPFYQYGEYKKYDPEHGNYYLPGSSVKGALQRRKSMGNHLMADDILVSNSDVVLRTLWKAQYLEMENKAVFEPFFENVGLEMIKGGTVLYGEMYSQEEATFFDVLESAYQDTRDKINQMCGHIQMLLEKDYSKDFKKVLEHVEENLYSFQMGGKGILVGGYKGLLHSIMLEPDRNENHGGLFIDFDTMLPHGLAKLELVSTL